VRAAAAAVVTLAAGLFDEQTSHCFWIQLNRIPQLVNKNIKVVF